MRSLVGELGFECGHDLEAESAAISATGSVLLTAHGARWQYAFRR
ncbi:hypothetical protein [Dactylosporangium sp. NPDC049140]